MHVYVYLILSNTPVVNYAIWSFHFCGLTELQVKPKHTITFHRRQFNNNNSKHLNSNLLSVNVTIDDMYVDLTDCWLLTMCHSFIKTACKNDNNNNNLGLLIIILKCSVLSVEPLFAICINSHCTQLTIDYQSLTTQYDDYRLFIG